MSPTGPRARPLRARKDTVLETVTQEILQLKARTARDLYALGVRLARVRDEQLWQRGKYSTFDDYLSDAVGFSRTSAYELIRIARHFNAEIAARYGLDKLRAVLAYMSATPVQEQPGDIFAANIQLRGPAGRFETRSLHDATAAQIREATTLLQETRRTRHARIPQKMQTWLRRLDASLPAAPHGLRGSRERVRLRRGSDGQLAVDLMAIPIDELRAALAALEEHLDEVEK